MPLGNNISLYSLGSIGEEISGSDIKEILTTIKLPETVISGTHTLSGSTEIVGSGTLRSGVTIKADDDNLNDVYVGGAGVSVGIGMRLTPGESIPVSIDELSEVYVIGTAGQKVHYLGG